MIVIAGLGNPGEKYSNTRHNIGFMVSGKLAEKYSIDGKFESKFNAIVGKGSINEKPVLIIQPMTFMNLSGESVAKILNFYKIPVENLFIIFDDISLDLGKVRFRKDGSDGGHNGIKSIINNISTSSFSRLKVGIGPQPRLMPSEAFVLQSFNKDEKELLEKVIDLSVEATECYIANGIDSCQCKYNGINLAE